MPAMSRVISRLCLALLLLAGASCQSTNSLSLVVLRIGPRSDLPPAEQQRVMAGHFANMRKLARERQLLLAGPFIEPRRDPGDRGIFVFATGDPAEARALTSTDPGFLAGIFTGEHHTLRTDADLASVRDRELELDAAAEAAGGQRAPDEGGRNYVLLRNVDGAALERALAPLRAAGKIVLLGRLDGTGGIAILDAVKLADAEAMLAEVRPQLGAHTLDPWFASGELARLTGRPGQH
jgi:uncharacterized protein YciI